MGYPSGRSVGLSTGPINNAGNIGAAHNMGVTHAMGVPQSMGAQQNMGVPHNKGIMHSTPINNQNIPPHPSGLGSGIRPHHQQQVNIQELFT